MQDISILLNSQLNINHIKLPLLQTNRKIVQENKKWLNKDIKVFIDKKTMNSYLDEKTMLPGTGTVKKHTITYTIS